MKKTFQIIGLISLTCFSFFVTEKTATVVNNMDEIMVEIKEKTEFEVKDIAKLEDTLTEEQISLARWMAKRYFSNASDCIKLMLTPGTRNKDVRKKNSR